MLAGQAPVQSNSRRIGGLAAVITTAAATTQLLHPPRASDLICKAIWLIGTAFSG